MLVKNDANSRRVTSADGSRVYELLNPMSDPIPEEVSLAKAVVHAGQVTRPHTLEFAEIYYVLEGEGLATVGGKTAKLAPGDALYIPKGAVQNIANTGEKDLVFLCVCQPAYRPEGDGVVG